MNSLEICDKLQFRGFHMAEDNVRELQDKAIVRYVRAKKQMQVANARLEGVAKEMDVVAKALKLKDAETLADFGFGPFEWLVPEEIHKRAHDAVVARTELIEARQHALDVGAPIE